MIISLIDKLNCDSFSIHSNKVSCVSCVYVYTGNLNSSTCVVVAFFCLESFSFVANLLCPMRNNIVFSRCCCENYSLCGVD